MASDVAIDRPGRRPPATWVAVVVVVVVGLAVAAVLVARPSGGGSGTAAAAHDHAGHEGHDTFGPVREVALTPAQQARFDVQWAAAADAAARLATPEQAAAAGYQPASAEGPGLGAHWIDWKLVGRSFDPAHPAMLLFSTRPGHQALHLVGLSYWAKSADEPAGFAGPNDHWHRHHGLCFVAGYLQAEGVEAGDCAGRWIQGDDLWMLHAWVAPGVDNRWGRFAPRNPALCPGDSEKVADVVRCPRR